MKIKLSQLLVWIIIIIFGINFLSQITGIVINELVYFVIVLFYMFYINKRTDKTFGIKIVFIISYITYGILLLIFNNSGIGSVYTVLTGIVVAFAFQEVVFTKSQKNVLILILLIGNVYWGVMSNGWYEKYMNALKLSQSIVNPNGVGYFICFSYIYIFILLYHKKNIFVQIFKAFGFIWSIAGILNVHARMALVMFLVFFIMAFLMTKIKKKTIVKRLIKISLIVSIITEIVFPVIYIMLYIAGFAKQYLYMGIAEKGLYSGRERIWINAFMGMTNIKDWLFGVGSKMDYWEGHSLNMHNNAMHLLVVFGILGLIAYFGFLIYLIYKEFDFNNYSHVQLLLIIFFIVILFGGSSDVMLFYNDFMLFVFVPLGISLNKNYLARYVK